MKLCFLAKNESAQAYLREQYNDNFQNLPVDFQMRESFAVLEIEALMKEIHSEFDERLNQT